VSGVPRLATDRSFAAEPRSRIAEHPALNVKRSQEGPTVECLVTTTAVVQTAGRD